MKCFIRSASWVTAGFGQRFAGKGGTNYKCMFICVFCAPLNLAKEATRGANQCVDNEKQREILRNNPEKYLAYRKKIESELNSRFRFILNGSKEQADARKV